MKPPSSAIVLLLAASLACASGGGVRDLSGAWTGELVVESLAFPASVRLSQVGSRIAGPAESPGMRGSLEGEVSGERVEFEAEYTAQGCRGTMVGSGEVSDDGATMAGELAVVDSCSGRSRGRFTLRREAG